MTAAPTRAAAVIALALAACGTDTGSECAAPQIDVAAQLATADDVRPIVARACAIGGCHLSAPGAGGLVLDMTSPAWITALVDVPARQSPSLALIVPGDPAQSWLVRKLDGEFCPAQCPGGCGGRMPVGEPLTAAERATIIAWIESGASRSP
jgi:hypothetical protein